MQYNPIGMMSAGDVFLLMRGEDRRLGLIYASDSGDRGPGSASYVLENGSRGHEPDFNVDAKAIVLDRIPDAEIGQNPLRTLLNWAAKYGG